MTRRFSFIALGDMPYKQSDHNKFASLIEQINRLAPEFSVHVGDIKKAKRKCSDERYERVLAHFGTFSGPLIYTPGDNDWADCHKERAGSFDPLERLATIREKFFPAGRSLGMTPMALDHQADDPSHRDMVENARWRIDDTLFLTVHVTGDNNNLGRDPETDFDYRSRDDANLSWIESGFEAAITSGLNGLVIFTHANLWVERDRRPKKRFRDEDQQEGFRQTIKAIRKGAKAFGRPVLVVQGDKHRLIIDQPLTRSKDDDLPLDNVIRLQVMGAEQVNAVVVTVDPSTASVFSMTPLL